MNHILIGAGGHSKVVVDILKSQGKQILGLLDDNTVQGQVLDLPVLGTTKMIPDLLKIYSDAAFIVCIGDNLTRRRIVEQLKPYNLNYGQAIHPSAVLGSKVIVKDGSVIMPNVVINADTIIGEHSIMNTACSIDHDCKIGDYVHISPGANLAGNVCVGSYSQVGIGSCVIQGIRIGTNSIIGAGACVVRDVEDNHVVVGCPAKKLRANRRI